MPFQLIGILTIVLQIFFAVHAMKRYKRHWVWIIIFFPLVGCAAYFFVEYLPQQRRMRNSLWSNFPSMNVVLILIVVFFIFSELGVLLMTRILRGPAGILAGLIFAFFCSYFIYDRFLNRNAPIEGKFGNSFIPSMDNDLLICVKKSKIMVKNMKYLNTQLNHTMDFLDNNLDTLLVNLAYNGKILTDKRNEYENFDYKLNITRLNGIKDLLSSETDQKKIHEYKKSRDEIQQKLNYYESLKTSKDFYFANMDMVYSFLKHTEKKIKQMYEFSDSLEFNDIVREIELIRNDFKAIMLKLK